jgi:hypothetical protein
MPLLSTFGAASARAFGLFNNLKEEFISLFSLRFNPESLDQLSRTPTVESNRKTWTYSLWVKRGFKTASSFLLDTTTGGNDKRFSIRFTSGDSLEIQDDQGASAVTLRQTTQLFRDYSAWYHIVVVLDTTQATANDRLKIYVNGSQVTSFITTNNPSQNADLLVNDNIEHSIGRGLPDRDYLSAYLSQIYLIDGQALTPSSFGETDTESGIWIPKTYTGTYGTNGFFLEFENSASLGTDSSGNGNNWTLNNLTSIDQTTDAPNNNFATFNPLVRTSGTLPTYSNGNLTVTGGIDGAPLSSIEVPKIGKWYCEIKVVSSSEALSGSGRVGIINYEKDYEALYLSDAKKKINGTETSYGASYAVGDILGIAVNSNGNEITFYKNGVSQTAISYTMQADQTYFFTAIDGGNTNIIVYDANFGNPPFAIVSGNSDANGFGNFEYAVPSGYYALCTKNLSEYA